MIVVEYAMTTQLFGSEDFDDAGIESRSFGATVLSALNAAALKPQSVSTEYCVRKWTVNFDSGQNRTARHD
jgi:hypothetical protein